jgi:hypothetical protein
MRTRFLRPVDRATIRLAGAAALLMLGAADAQAQSIEPRAYSNAPVGVNFVISGFAYTRGPVAFDPALPLTDAKLRTSSLVLAYARTLDLWGRSGKFDLIVPYVDLSGSALYNGDPVERQIAGLADPALRLSVNFFGAPALSLAEFRAYRQDLIAGASLQVSVPAGQYDPTRLVNIGSHRWSFKPELGVSKASGPWTVEFQASAKFFTANDSAYNGSRVEQDPIYSLQGHTIYNFRDGSWASLDATYFAGGRTTVNGTLNNDLQANWRVGGTLSLPVNINQSVKFYLSSGVAARTGNSFDLIGAAWQYRWGGGL